MNASQDKPERDVVTLESDGAVVPAPIGQDASTSLDESGADTPVTVSVTHGSLENARFALMVAVYVDEAMSGTERFLDGQFDGRLSGWRDIERYSGQLGESLFIEPGRDVASGHRPNGAYLVGLGSTLTLGRFELSHAVRRALVERCLKLYGGGTGGATTQTQLIEVGFSTTLLGVRNDDGLRVEDSVTGILEGLVQANRDLARFEVSTRTGRVVRITTVEFIERYGDRASRAANAVRGARAVAGLTGWFVGLDKIVVTSEEGGLPSSAALIDADASWRRFLITEQRPADTVGPSVSGQPPGQRTLTLDVTSFGRDARSDRVTHQIDVASIEALVARVTTDRNDDKALQALRDRLVPNELRAQFVTSSAIHLLVDATTAQYPWELLAMPSLSRHGSNGGRGSVLRLFAESENRRLQPDRATVGSALIIAAGKPGSPYQQLDGVFKEAEAVRAILEHHVTTTLVDDAAGPLDVADINIKLNGDNQILHIAGHGVHVEGAPARTGAVLNDRWLLTTKLVSSLPIVPELVFLNCCSIGRIGQSRLAAGLAREFMALGVRAVVAAAWSIGDDAAVEFAKGFYECMISGRSFGDAIKRARDAAGGGGHTWAAYQCYGDPSFVLRGRLEETGTDGEPVGPADLIARLEALNTRIADLSRPSRKSDPRVQADALSKRQQALIDARNRLAACADAQRWVKNDAVQRLLALTARNLGAFGEAATRYGTFVRANAAPGAAQQAAQGPPSPPVGRLDRRTSSPFDLQQYANCLARAMQVKARTARDEGNTVEWQCAVDQLREAEVAAIAAVETLRDNESLAILASVYKKWATVDEGARSRLIAKGNDVYLFGMTPDDRERQAAALVGDAEPASTGISGAEENAYGVENAVQFVALTDVERARRLQARLIAEAPAPAARVVQQSNIYDAAPPKGADFWAEVGKGDQLLTALMLTTDPGELIKAADDLAAVYLLAFRSRSTFAERSSTIDHVGDLAELLPVEDPRHHAIQTVRRQIARWTTFAPTSDPKPESS